MYIRAIQGHTGENMIAPELMGHVAIPHNWKYFVFHRGCSFNTGGKESKEGRQTIFFTPLNAFGKIQMKKNPSDDLSIPRKVHQHSNWKHDQDAVYWKHCLVRKIKDYDSGKRNLTQ